MLARCREKKKEGNVSQLEAVFSHAFFFVVCQDFSATVQIINWSSTDWCGVHSSKLKVRVRGS